MAGVRFTAATGEISLTAATAKTVVQITAPTNQKVKVKGFGVHFKGSSATDAPALIRVLKQTTAGTMTSLTPRRTNAGSETVQTTAQHTATAEPTASDVKYPAESHPQSFYEKIFPDGMELEVPGGERLGIEVTASANVSCTAFLDCEE